MDTSRSVKGRPVCCQGHTPGPWYTGGNTIYSAPTDASPSGYAIATVLNPYAGAVGAANRVDANADLIAAAPALAARVVELEGALEKLIAVCAPNIYPQPDKPDSAWSVLEAARAALKESS